MKTLIFSIALNGYEVGYQSCINSQRRYAEGNNADYRIALGYRASDPALAAWLKVPLLISALQSHYDKVAYLDADCEVRPKAPNFFEEISADSPLAMAYGRSERLNSGVIFAHQSPVALSFFQQVLNSATQPVEAEHRNNLRFENGNIISVHNERGGVRILDSRWNNSSDPNLDDYIRHYTGPMSSQLEKPPLKRLRERLVRRLQRRHQVAPKFRHPDFMTDLEELASTVAEEWGLPQLPNAGYNS